LTVAERHEVIDRHKAWRQIGERIERTPDAHRRAMLECVRTHILVETDPDFDRLMATMCASPAFHFWIDGNGMGGGPKGLDAVQAHYRNLIAEKRYIFEIDIDRIVVDERTVVTEGWFRQIFPGTTLQSRGVEVANPDAAHLVTTRLLLLWPFTEDGELIGEDSYAGGRMFAPESIRELADDEIPEDYRRALAR
jgi:hypothetical protein